MRNKKDDQPSPSPTWAESLTSVATLAAEKADVLVSSMSSAVGATLESITPAVSSPSTAAEGEKITKELDGKVHSAYFYSLGAQETLSAHSARVRAKASELKDAAIESSKRSSARVGEALGQDLHEHTAAGLAVFLLLTLLVACLINRKASAARARADSSSTTAVTAADNAPGASAADVTSTAATVVSDIVQSESKAETETKMEVEVEVSGAARAREVAEEEGAAPAPSKVASPSESCFASSGGNASCEEAQESTPASELFAETEGARKSATTPDIPLGAPAAPAAVDAAAATDVATASATADIADDVQTVSTEVKSQAPEEPASNELVAELAAPQEQTTVDAVEEQAEEDFVVGVTTCDADSFGNVATGSTEFTVDVAATLPEEVVPGPEPTDGASVMGVVSSGASNAAQEAEQEEELPEPADDDAIRAGAEASGEGVGNTFQHQLALQKILQEELPAPAPTAVLPDAEASGSGVASTAEEAVQEEAVQEGFEKEIVHEKLEEETETAEVEPPRPSAEAETRVDQKVAEKAAVVSDVSAIAASSTEGPPTTMAPGAASAMTSAAMTAIASAAVLEISTPIALATDEPADKPITMAGDCDSSKDEDASTEGGDAAAAATPLASVPPAGPDHPRCEQGEVAAATGSRGDAAVNDVILGAADETIVAGAGAATSVVPEEVADVVMSTSHVGEFTPLDVQDVAAAPSDGGALSSAVDAKQLFGSGPGVGENERGAVAGGSTEVTAGAGPAAAAEEETEEEDVIASSMVEQEQETVGIATAVDGDKAAKQDDDTVIPAAWEQSEAASLASRSEKLEGASGIAGASPGAEGSPSNLSAPIGDLAVVTVAPAAEMSELPRVEATMGAVQPAALLEATPGTVATTAVAEEAETRIDTEPMVEAPMEAIPKQPMAASKESDEPVTMEKGLDKDAAPGTTATLATTVAATGAFFPLLTDVEVKAEEGMTGQASAEGIPAIPTKPGMAVEEAAEPAALVEGSEEVTVVTMSSTVTADVDVEAEQEAQPEPEPGLEVEAPPGAIPTQPAATVEKTNQPAKLKEDSEKAATKASATTPEAAKAFFALVADVDVNAEEEPKGQSAFEGMATQPAAAVEEAFEPIAPVENSGGSTPVTTAWAAEAQTRIKAEPETQPELEVEAPPGAIPAQAAVTIEKANEPATLKEDFEEAALGTTATSAATAATAKAFFALVGDVEVNAGKEPKGQGAFESIPTQPAVAVEEAFGRMAPIEDLEGVTSLTTASAAAAQAGMKAKVEPDLELNINVPVEAIPTQPATTASETAEPVALVEGFGIASPGTIATSKGAAAAANLSFALVNDVEVNAEEEPGGQATIEANRAQPAVAVEEASEPTAPVGDSEGATSVTTGSTAAAQAEMETEVERDSELNTNIPMEAIPTHPATTASETVEPVAPVEDSSVASPGPTTTSMATATAVKSLFALLGDGGVNTEEELRWEATTEANCTQPASAVEEASEPTAPVEDSERATSVTTGSAAVAPAKMETEVEPDSELNTNIPLETIPTHPATTASEAAEPVAAVEGSGTASPGTTATSMATAAAAKSFVVLVAGVGGEVVPEPEGQATVEVNHTQPAVAVEEASESTVPVEDSEGATSVMTGSAAAAQAEMKTEVEPDSALNLNVPMEAIPTQPATTASETAEPVAPVEGSGIASPGKTATSKATAAAAKSFVALVAGVEGEVVPEPEGQATVEVNRTQPAVAVEEASEPTAPVEDSEGATSVTTGSAAAAQAEPKTEGEPDSELNLSVPVEAIPTHPAATASETAEPVAAVEGSGTASPGKTATSKATAAAVNSFFALVAGVEGEVVPEPEGQATVEVNHTQPAVAVEEASEPTAPVEDSVGTTSVTTGSAAAAQAETKTKGEPDSELNLNVPMEAIPTQPATTPSETAEPVVPVEDSGIGSPGKTATSKATAAAAKLFFAMVGDGGVNAEKEPRDQATIEMNRTQPASAIEEASEPTAPVEDSEGTTSVTTGSAAAAQAEMKTEVEPGSGLNLNVSVEAIPTQPATTASETAEPVAPVEGSGIASPGTTATSRATMAAAKSLFALVADVGGDVVAEPAPESGGEAPTEVLPMHPAVTGETAKPVALVEDSGKAATSMATAAAAKALFALVADVEEEAVPKPAPESEFEAPMEAIPTQPAVAVGEAAKPAALAEDSGGAAPETTKASTVTSAAAKMFFAMVADEGGEVSSDEKSKKTEDVEGDAAARRAAGDGHEAAASGAKGLEPPDAFPSPFVAYAGPGPAKKPYDDMFLELETTESAVAASESTPSNKHHSLGASFFRRRRDRSGEGSDLEGGKEHPSHRKMLKKLNPFKGLRRKSSDKPT